MSPKRLLWIGLFCFTLAVLTAGLGLLAQAVLIVVAICSFHITIQVPVSATHRMLGQTSLSVPSILPVVLSVAWFLLAIALGCLFESGRRVLGRRRPA